MHRSVKLKPNVSYPIHISANAWARMARCLRRLIMDHRLFVVSQQKIKKLYGAQLVQALGRKVRVEWILVPDGERAKTLAVCEKILVELSRRGAGRASLIAAFGGGVVGDVAGFCAAIYMRGIRFVQIPTTLLAQVDASVGGKTGVDLVTGKNLAGAFHQPQAVFIITDTLASLTRGEFLSGMAEVIKYGVIGDADFFAWLDKNREAVLRRSPTALAEIVRRSVTAKAHVVAKDEKESGLRAILNYGHTLGHAVETLAGYRKVRHGFAVAMGMAFAARLGEALGVSRKGTVDKVVGLLSAYGLPTCWPNYPAKDYLKLIARDKKASFGKLRFILPEKIGKVSLFEVRAGVVGRCLKKNG